MKYIDFTQTGGYRLKQNTLARMQEAYFQLLHAFITYLKVPSSGSYIISGCEISGANITDGILYIDGDLCAFSQTAGDLTTKIQKIESVESLSFKSGLNLPVFRTTSATTSLTEGIELSAFTRLNVVQDNNYVHTDNNFTNALLAHLNSIETGAEVNVQADWNVINPNSDAYIKNIPNLPLLLDKGVIIIGDVYTNESVQNIQVPILHQEDNDYTVIVSFESITNNATEANYTTTMFYTVFGKLQDSFRIYLRESSNSTQFLRINWMILK
ncbi:hypothetical protein FIA58_013770 [Flavobacterium jejuense]|uniref:DUF5689 domain-containing protein n=1 Tax=Flavobacterium jejuense TaxID=1544455 RepID=A0ABX0ITA3_9FLAO|nr:hypothetical protein [Flavobacterium jejuense]NHN26748.1 hypothetical protein [Flavobacterium jejuense]